MGAMLTPLPLPRRGGLRWPMGQQCPVWIQGCWCSFPRHLSEPQSLGQRDPLSLLRLLELQPMWQGVFRWTTGRVPTSLSCHFATFFWTDRCCRSFGRMSRRRSSPRRSWTTWGMRTG